MTTATPQLPRRSDGSVDVDALPMLSDVTWAARVLGISRSAAYRAANTGELPAKKLGGRTYIVTAKLFELVNA